MSTSPDDKIEVEETKPSAVSYANQWISGVIEVYCSLTNDGLDALSK